MKRCPTCHSVYTDDSLSYCLQDGTRLAVMSDSASDVTLQMGAGERSFGSDAPPTEIIRPEDMPTARIEQAVPTKEQQRARPTALNGSQQPPLTGAVAPAATRSNAPVVALSIVVAILLIALGGLITWVMMRDRRQTQQQQTRATSSNQNEARQSNTTPMNSNANAAVTTATPQASPSVDVAAAQKEIQSVLNAWAGAVRQRNLDEHMKYYAGVLDVYYNATNVSRDRVRDERELAFSKYSSMDMQVSNLTISVEPSGTRATATFDKTFDFRNDEKTFSGSGLNRFWFTKTGGGWRITGEKELKNYYVNK